MNFRDEIISKIKHEYPYLSSEFGVKRIGLFGSVAKQSNHNQSDVDIVVELSRPIGLKFVLLKEYLENVFNRKVDVLTLAGLKNIRVKRVASSIEKDIIYV